MKKKTIIIFSALILILLAWFVLAVAGDEVKIVAPTSGTNFTSITGTIFNVSFVNGSDITSPSNATFFLNISGTWQAIGNTSASSGCDVGATTSSCAANITNTTIPDGVYSLNATINNGTTISVTHTGNLSTLITIDGTAPAVQEANFSSPTSGTNQSGSIILNVSVIDATIGIQTVFFNVTNSTGGQNATFTATNPAGNSWNATLNTAHFPDGTYNITVFANDTLNNLNNSARVRTIKFDNTAPSASASCSPTSVKTGADFPCSCSGSDATSGVSTSSGSSDSPDGTASPSNTGVFTYTCSVTDKAGNSASSSKEYTVTGGGSSSSGSGGGGGSSSSSSSDSDSGQEEPQQSPPEPETTQTTSDEESATQTGVSSRGISTGATIGIILGIVVLVIIIIIGLTFTRKAKKTKS